MWRLRWGAHTAQSGACCMRTVRWCGYHRSEGGLWLTSDLTGAVDPGPFTIRGASISQSAAYENVGPMDVPNSIREAATWFYAGRSVSKSSIYTPDTIYQYCRSGGMSVEVSRAATSPDRLSRRIVEHRAVEAVIWGMPAVNFELLYQAKVGAGGAWNQIVYWTRPST